MLVTSAVSLAACSGDGSSGGAHDTAPSAPRHAAPSMHVSSPDWLASGPLRPPTACAHHGDHGRSPALRWSAGPSGTKYYDVTIVDADADHFLHWAALDIPASTTSLAAGAHGPAKQLRNDFGYLGYGAPCPPRGSTHHYVLTVWAEARQVSAVADLPKHALASAKLTAQFGP